MGEDENSERTFGLTLIADPKRYHKIPRIYYLIG